MADLAHHFAACAYNNAWANHRLLRACGLLSPADFTATRTSFFPSIAATLNHNLTVDWYYVDAMERAVRGAEPNLAARAYFEPPVPFPAHAELAAAQRAVDDRLIALCRGLTDAQLALAVPILRSTGLVAEPLGRMLPHLFEHQVHHRGQAHAMLAGTSVAPPQLDEFFCVHDASERAADFDELGYTEALIWPQ